MRGVLAATIAVAVLAGGVGGQDKKGTAKGESKYLPVKELNTRAKDALDLVKKRERDYVDKGLLAFAEVITKADPKNAASRHVAGQAGFFMGKLYYIKLQSATTDEEREKLTADRLRWVNAAPLSGADNSSLTAVWETIEREWSLEDMKKK